VHHSVEAVEFAGHMSEELLDSGMQE
jgi:hypothetical protein